MKICVLALCFLVAVLPLRAAPTAAQHSYVAYAEFLAETPVSLSDGTEWVMDLGDCFPIYMFKDNQTKVVLQIGSATFTVEASKVHMVKDVEAPRALQSYRKTLENYLESRVTHWRAQAR